MAILLPFRGCFSSDIFTVGTFPSGHITVDGFFRLWTFFQDIFTGPPNYNPVPNPYHSVHQVGHLQVDHHAHRTAL